MSISNNGKDTIISSRVRLARNLSEYPFCRLLSKEGAEEVISKIEKALGGNFKKTDFGKISQIEARAYAENHLVSPEFAELQSPHALFTDEKGEVYIMACEEDHIRLQCILPGFSLDRAYEIACEYDDKLDGELDIAYSEKLGYLTHCPTNLGTGMRASVMMFLPALTMAGKIGALSSQLSKIGFTIRGMFGEGSEAGGKIYQISNQITLGISEEDTIKKLKEIIEQINDSELKLRDAIKDKNYLIISDKICRAEGILKYAQMISSGEFMKLYADIRLGIGMGIIDDIKYEQLDRLLTDTLPANLIIKNSGKHMNETERDIARAEYIKSALK